MPGIARVMSRLLLAAALPSLGACGLGGPAYGPASGAAAVVDMHDSLAFEPELVRIKAGETVVWRNRSVFTHSVTDDPARAKDADDAQLPEGAEPFSASVGPGQVYHHSFTVPGTYHYFCMPHEGWGMHGQVIVAPAT